MLEHTFCHIPGIGAGVEKKLWAAGITDWETALATENFPVLKDRADLIRARAAEASGHLRRRSPGYFMDSLPPREHWRLFPHFNQRVAYLDIETTGTQTGADYITTICVYDGADVRHYVHNQNMDAFIHDIRGYDLLVTYNGKSFDLPFIRNYFGLAMNHAHIDLRHVFASLGFKGGLKGIEKQLGIDRGPLDGVDGYFAVLLWREFFTRGNQLALETLLAYNMMDVINLESLMVTAYNMKLAGTPFADHLSLTASEPPEIPFAPDLGTIRRLRAGQNHWR
ncbi:MAG: ribonuclease H-like domain-containing protein [Lentisphaeria bacterium]|nr:ribonuclease H-like domain-containing protein [Lentisphaeria bacterium]